MQNQTSSPRFQVLQIPQSPVAVSPNRNLTGSARVARDIIADLFNGIQNWNDFHIKGAQLVKNIGALKADSMDEFSSELEECTNNLHLLVQKLKTCLDQFCKSQNQIIALKKTDRRQEPLFTSLSIGNLCDLVEDVVNGYINEYKVKELVLENIAHSKNKNELMFFAACWTHQPNITSQINLKLETLLVETGHRKVT